MMASLYWLVADRFFGKQAKPAELAPRRWMSPASGVIRVGDLCSRALPETLAGNATTSDGDRRAGPG